MIFLREFSLQDLLLKLLVFVRRQVPMAPLRPVRGARYRTGFNFSDQLL